MSILYIMIPMSLLLGFGFLASFIWSVHSGQLDDTTTPANKFFDELEKDMNERTTDEHTL